jgi:hypothetical protein
MQEFKSKIGNSLGGFFILTISFFGLLYLTIFLASNFRLTQVTFLGWLIVVLMYSILSYLYVGLVNNDILLFDNRLEIVNRLPLFKKHKIFYFDKIIFVKFKHEWTETFGENIRPKPLRYIFKELLAPLFFPIDYKWIKIGVEKNYKFYCFGLTMDFCENETEPVFEHLFIQLAEKGVNVSWTNTSDVYYSQMTKNLEDKNKKMR